MQVILGDPHVGKNLAQGRAGIGSVLNSRIVDQLDLLDWTLEQTLCRGGHHIIITGDIFEDTKPAPYLLALFISWLKKCEDNGIQVHIIQGNHDMLRTGMQNTSSLDVIIESDLPNVSVYKDITTVFIDDTAFTFVPFRDRKFFGMNSNAEAVSHLSNIIAYELASIPNEYRKVLIGHLAIEGSMFVGDEVDDVANELFCPLSMFAGYDYVWMGHVHKPQVMQTKTASRPHVAHIGSMDISNFKEVDEEKILVLLDDGFQTLPLPTRPLKKIAITVPADTKNPTQFVIDQVSKVDLSRSITKIEVQFAAPDLLPIDRDTLEKHLYSKGTFNVSGITQSKTPSIIKKDDTLNTTMSIPASIKTWIETHIQEDKQAAALELALDCYREYEEMK
jgi:DNA repair exonuclease SbcCD nuclease subunit